jgi:transcription elongation GreA/GreB family factor
MMPLRIARWRLDKHIIVEKVIAALRQEFEGSMRSARAAHAEATDEQSKAENKYDTRGLEASYLARGQSRQAAEATQALQAYAALSLREFTAAEPIALGSLVEVEEGGRRTFYFIGPRAGGTEVDCEGTTVLVLTPQSPLGQELVGRRIGESFGIGAGSNVEKCRIICTR